MDKRVIGLVLFMIMLGVGGGLFRASMGLGPFDRVTKVIMNDPPQVIPVLLLFIGGIAFLLLLRKVIRAMEKESQDEKEKGEKRCRGTGDRSSGRRSWSTPRRSATSWTR